MFSANSVVSLVCVFSLVFDGFCAMVANGSNQKSDSSVAVVCVPELHFMRIEIWLMCWTAPWSKRGLSGYKNSFCFQK